MEQWKGLFFKHFPRSPAVLLVSRARNKPANSSYVQNHTTALIL